MIHVRKIGKRDWINLVVAIMEIFLALLFIGAISLIFLGINKGNLLFTIMGSIVVAVYLISFIIIICRMFYLVKKDKEDVKKIREEYSKRS